MPRFREVCLLQELRVPFEMCLLVAEYANCKFRVDDVKVMYAKYTGEYYQIDFNSDGTPTFSNCKTQ